MKKSEMIQLIADSLHPCNSGYKSSREKTAKRILEVIGDIMLPPLNNWDYYMDGDHADVNDLRYRCWEPENEEK